MKRLLLLALLLFTNTIILAQTWTGLGANTNWNNTDNWDTNLVPTASDDVIIPTGFTVTLNVAGNIKSIDVQGNAVFDMNTNLTFTSLSSFGINTTINWNAGTINGTTSSLTNQGTLNLISTNSKYIQGDTTLNNSGTINIIDSGNLYISQGIVNNTSSGVIDMQADNGDISWSGGSTHILNNSGTIKRTTGLNEAKIVLELNNNDGTIQVESGTLSFQNAIGKNLTDGTYNVFSGAVLDWDGTITVLGTLNGTIDGDLNWNNFVTIATSTVATFNFTGAGNFNWTAGTLNGGGTLTNLVTLNLTSTISKYIQSDTILNNSGTINIIDSGNLYISQGVLNNQVSGVIDMQADTGDISFSGGTSHILNNSGIIKRTTTIGVTNIFAELHNNDGTISAESGTLVLNNAANVLTAGTYNVSTGSSLNWLSTITASGILTGTIDGDLNWSGILFIPTTATFSGSGTGNFNWTTGQLKGGGTLTNQGILNLTTTASKYFFDDTILNNEGLINMASSGNLYITQGILNNQVSGIIDLQVDGGNITWSGGTSHILNNFGLLKKTSTSGVSLIQTETNNSGIIDIQTGELEFSSTNSLNNQINGVIKGIATLDLPSTANFTNNGTFAPGESPGKLTVLGDYKSTTNSVLDIELDGLTPITEYDVLAITGNNVVFEGSVNITLGFEPDVNDFFDIATVSGTMATKNLVSPIIVESNGKRYTFDVSYPNDFFVRLTISQKLDIEPPTVVTQDITVQLDASGNVSITAPQIDNGSSDNCTLQANLIFALDVTDFTCSNLGANTVTLTVTDEAGNSANDTATVTVEDSIDPVAITQNITVQLDASGNASIVAADVNNASTDNCGIASMSLDVSSFTCSNLGANTVNLTVTDTSGNTNSASATLTVEDNINPTISCPVDSSVDSSGDYTLPDYVVNGDVVGADNCSFNITQNPTAGTILPDGTYIIDFTITDSAGNTNTCSFNLTVNDTTLSIGDEELKDTDILLFPNPVSNQVTLRNTTTLELINLSIMDVKGSIIQTIDLSRMGTNKLISTQFLPSGVYFVRINTKTNTIVKRLIKQ